MKYTVIGIQDEDTVEVVGVFAGHHSELSEGLPDTWVQHVEADSAIDAHITGLDQQLQERSLVPLAPTDPGAQP